MDQNTEVKIEMLREGARKYLEAAKDAVCECCRWPYLETDQGAMDERCDSCEVMAAMEQQWDQAYAVGRAVGMVESAVMVAKAFEAQHDQIAAKSRAEFYKL